MIYPESFESKIGFDAVRSMVASKCASPLGAAFVEAMSFSDEFNTVETELKQVDEFRRIITSADTFPGGAIKDITGRLQAIRPEGTHLTAAELVDMGISFATMADIASFFQKRHDEGVSPYPELNAIASEMVLFPVLARSIDRIVDRWGDRKSVV